MGLGAFGLGLRAQGLGFGKSTVEGATPYEMRRSSRYPLVRPKHPLLGAIHMTCSQNHGPFWL